MAQPIETFALIIGAMKSGTSSLFQYLATHPEICASRRKEPQFFSQEDRYALGQAWYFDLWPTYDPATHKAALEASTGYTKSGTAKVIRRIAALGGQFRFIYILRSPLDRIKSHVLFGESTAPTDLDDRRVAISKYASYVDAYVKAFGRDSILLLDFDDLVTDPGTVLQRCEAFLGLSAHDFPILPPANPTPRERFAGYDLPTPMERAIRAELAPDMRRLTDVYGFPTRHWGF